ncbi:MAG: hypothetical protein RLY35_2129 [Bacteroidota bacterium]|jgi:glycosyltransferase involved in cell wall biosynthesis
MRILHIIPQGNSPSSFIFAKRQVIDLKRIGNESESFLFNTRISLVLLFKQLISLREKLRHYCPDVLHAHYGTYTAFFASLMCGEIPLIITLQGSDIQAPKEIHYLRKITGKWMGHYALRKAQKIICVSEQLKNLIPKHAHKCSVIPCGIDLSTFHPQDKAECKKQLGLREDIQYVFFNGNNPKVKRLDIAESVVNQLKKESYPIELLQLNGNVSPNDIPHYINASELVLLCSDHEGSPMIIKESLACNKPIVSVDVGDVRDRIHGVEGTFIVHQNTSDICDKIRKILDDEIVNSDGMNKILNDQLDSISTAKRIEDIYHSCAKFKTIDAEKNNSK